MTKPLIGIILDEQVNPKVGIDFSSRPYYALRKDYINMVKRVGGVPLLIPYAHDDMDRYIDLIDGLIATGADHRFDPEWYTNPEDVPDLMHESERRGFEDIFVRRTIDRDLPFLGICNGMQVMGCVFGAKIRYGNDPNQNNPGGVRHSPDSNGPVFHDVIFEPGSLSCQIYGVDRMRINSAHKEALIDSGEGLVITGRAEDGIIEAIEHPGRRFAVGLQWHPEIGQTEADVDPVFHAFKKACEG